MEKITLTKEQETLLIPLYSKAQPHLPLDDAKAREIIAAVDYDFSNLNVPQKTTVTLHIRARQLDEFTSAFIAAHPNALILHLGCGLDSRCLRVRRGETLWIDLDLPDVIDLRRKFYNETSTYRMIASSVTDLAWIDQVQAGGRPVFIVAEGLFMYLPEDALRALILRLQQQFPGARLVFDAFSKETARRVGAHPSLRKTGAAVQWGIDDPHEMEQWSPGIRCEQEWFFSQFEGMDRLPWFYRFVFRLTRSLSAVQRAQRLLVFTLA